MKINLFLFLCFWAIDPALSQDYIQLQNPSFEDAPGAGQTPMGWQDCSIGHESPPDIHASINQTFFGVNHPSYDGNTYVGMVVRENDTWEAIGQKLSVPMQGKECYVFNIYLARSGDYQSPTRLSSDPVSYKKPAMVTLWGGYDYCDRAELLAQSPQITNFEWQDYQFFFQPSKTYTHFIIEAYFAENDGVAYNGNVLLDLASPLMVANCETGVEELKSIDSEIVIEPKVKPKSERLQSLSELKVLMKSNIEHLIYDVNAIDLSPTASSTLLKIAQAKLDFSRYRLSIVVKANPAELAKERIQAIKELFLKEGLPETSFKIYHERVSDQEKTWIGENPFFRLGLQDRLK